MKKRYAYTAVRTAIATVILRPTRAAMLTAMLTSVAISAALPGRALALEPGGDEAAQWIASLPAAAADRLRLAAAALDRGDAETALKIYELVSGEGEYLEAETGQVRAALANGETRKAVAYGSRVADENRDSLEAQLWLVYLVDRTGKPEFALENLDTMKPADAREARLLATLRAELLIDRGRATEALDALPAGDDDGGILAMRRRAQRVLGRPLSGAAPAPGAPAAWPPFFSESSAELPRATIAAGGVTIDAGRRVLTRLDAPAGTRVVVRSGSGLVRGGVIVPVASAAPVTVVRLDRSLPADTALAADGFAAAGGTRFCFTLGNRAADPERRSVVAVYPGIVFRSLPGTPYAAVTADADAGLVGAPLFDSLGRLIGLGAGRGAASGHPEAAFLALATEGFAAGLGVRLADGSAEAPGLVKPTSLELHERLQAASVQVFVVDKKSGGH